MKTQPKNPPKIAWVFGVFLDLFDFIISIFYTVYTFVPGPGKHIVSMHSKLQVLQKEKENLETKLANTEKEFKSELEMKIKVMKEENENLVKDAIEKTRAEGMCFLNFLPFIRNYIDISLV